MKYRNDVGSKINQYDDSVDEFVLDLLPQRKLNRWINQSFEDIYKWYALANRGRFSVPATTDTIAGEDSICFWRRCKRPTCIRVSMPLKGPVTDKDYTQLTH